MCGTLKNEAKEQVTPQHRQPAARGVSTYTRAEQDCSMFLFISSKGLEKRCQFLINTV